MSRKGKFLCLLAGLILVVGVAHATGTLQDFIPGFSGAGTVQIVTSFGTVVGTPGPLTTLRVHRGAAGSGGAFDVDFTIEIEATGVLTSAVLKTCTDQNGNGTIEPGEWTTVSTASIVENGGKTIATGSPVSLASDLDAYRVTYVRSDIGTTRETWRNNSDVEIPFP